MFAELMPLLAGRPVCIMASRIDDETLRVIVLPKPAKEGENAALMTPLCFTGTPQELDANFSQHLATYANTHAALSSTLAEAVAEMEAAAKAARDEAKRRAKAKTSAETDKAVAATPAPATAVTTGDRSNMGLFDDVTTLADASAAAAES
jgi:PRTRC genetic system protein E